MCEPLERQDTVDLTARVDPRHELMHIALELALDHEQRGRAPLHALGLSVKAGQHAGHSSDLRPGEHAVTKPRG